MMEERLPENTKWADATLAAALFAVTPEGINGINLRAQPGPVRDAWLSGMRKLLPAESAWRRIPTGITDSRLIGGLDLAATLKQGRPVAEQGLLAEADGGFVILAMAERVARNVAAVLGSTMDAGELILERDGLTSRTDTRFGIIALDEGITDDEKTPASLRERFAFEINLEGISYKETDFWPYTANDVSLARSRLADITITDDLLQVLCITAMQLGISSLRAPLLAQRVARAAAALAGTETVAEEHIVLACKLVYAHRATCAPAQEETQEDAPQQDNTPEPAADSADDEQDSQQNELPEDLDDIVLAATQAILSHKLLEQLKAGASSRSNRSDNAGRSNSIKQSQMRGRPVGVRKGKPGNGARLNVIETLRAAAPWQALRNRDELIDQYASQTQRRVSVQKEDFRITRFKQRTTNTTVFVVDASGSSALNRLAETKGAVELLLSECYQRRDQVALIAFRGRAAELVLPPTRSLVRAKRLLAGLPGGGATPLAAGIAAAAALADQIKQRGEIPSIVLLTDGRANINNEGQADRSTAEEDALMAARQIRGAQISAMVIDTSPRAQPFNRQVAENMDAHYLALPHADARTLSEAAMGSAFTTKQQSLSAAG